MIQVGQRFGAWEVLKDAGFSTKWYCVCRACNDTFKNIRAHDLKSGKTLMCKTCSPKKLKKSKDTDTTGYEYNSWVAMLQRCTNPNSKDYKNYGARGIKVFPVWEQSFEAFYMAIGPRPEPTYTLERIDYNKGYEPGNVKWIPKAEQSLNKRDNVHATIDGVTKLVSEWARDPGCTVDPSTVYRRLERGWDEKEAVFAPQGTKASRKKEAGKREE